MEIVKNIINKQEVAALEAEEPAFHLFTDVFSRFIIRGAVRPDVVDESETDTEAEAKFEAASDSGATRNKYMTSETERRPASTTSKKSKKVSFAEEQNEEADVIF